MNCGRGLGGMRWGLEGFRECGCGLGGRWGMDCGKLGKKRVKKSMMVRVKLNGGM